MHGNMHSEMGMEMFLSLCPIFVHSKEPEVSFSFLLLSQTLTSGFPFLSAQRIIIIGSLVMGSWRETQAAFRVSKNWAGCSWSRRDGLVPVWFGTVGPVVRALLQVPVD